MFKAMKRKLKDQRGLTLIELLAVIVILGIIAAIAVPSIGKLIDNTKDKAHIANAQQMVDAAKLYITTNNTALPKVDTDPNVDITLTQLITAGLLDEIKDPKTSDNYDPTSKVTVDMDGGKIKYLVTLKAPTPSGGSAPTPYINGIDVRTLQ